MSEHPDLDELKMDTSVIAGSSLSPIFEEESEEPAIMGGQFSVAAPVFEATKITAPSPSFSSDLGGGIGFAKSKIATPVVAETKLEAPSPGVRDVSGLGLEVTSNTKLELPSPRVGDVSGLELGVTSDTNTSPSPGPAWPFPKESEPNYVPAPTVPSPCNLGPRALRAKKKFSGSNVGRRPVLPLFAKPGPQFGSFDKENSGFTNPNKPNLKRPPPSPAATEQQSQGTLSSNGGTPNAYGGNKRRRIA